MPDVAAPGRHDLMRRPASPLRVLVAGGGFAAAELALALRALAEERVRIELIAPSTELPFRPAATAAPFGAAVDVYDLEAVASDAGAALRRDAVEAVASRAHRVRLASGAFAEYDVAVIAVGARARVGVPGAITFRDQRDHQLVTRVIDGAGAARRVVLCAPSGVSWTLPLYELALLAAKDFARRDLEAEVMVFTPEEAPLHVFGPRVASHVASMLEARAIRWCRGAAQSVARGSVTLSSGEAVDADAVIAVPRLVGRRISGVPADWNGFVATDPYGRVDSLDDVFAIGDVTRFPVKQGGLATQQADVVAAVLAARAGAPVKPPPVRHVLRARLLGADGACYLLAELDGDGAPLAGTQLPAVSSEADWWPAAKLFGRHLTPWLAAHGAAARQTPAQAARFISASSGASTPRGRTITGQ
jgi:sulfide:quinone oxidoreductase